MFKFFDKIYKFEGHLNGPDHFILVYFKLELYKAELVVTFNMDRL